MSQSQGRESKGARCTAVTGPSLVGHDCAHSLQVIRQLPRLRMRSIMTGIPHYLGCGTSAPEVGVSRPPLPGSHHCLQPSFTQTHACAHSVRTHIPHHTSALTRSRRPQPVETDSHSQLSTHPIRPRSCREPQQLPRLSSSSQKSTVPPWGSP